MSPGPDRGAAAAVPSSPDEDPRLEPPDPIWELRRFAPPSALASIVRDLRIDPIVASILWSRGLHDGPGGVRAALEPALEPAPISTLDAAAARIERALRAGERIRIHGDYDADGVSGTAVLALGLRALGAKVSTFIPNRLTDGYGIHPDRVPEHAEACDLFVTVDCGISNLDEVAALRSAGVDVIVTDHHTRGDALPDALVVHPRSEERDLPLTGAGVAFHLLWALHTRLGMEPPLAYADLATLGTVADVAPLTGENRALVREGLERMPDSAWPGVRAAVRHTKLRDGVTARDVAFRLAPRLNAAGRLGEADLALELLTTGSEQRARELAAYLDARNLDRRRIQSEMFDEALTRVDPDAPAVVIGDDAWHPGVMGIVASKILERVYKPVFIHAKGKGSVRSTPGISAVGALHAASAHLARYGGHAQAAGFSIDAERVGSFARAVRDYVGEHPRPVPRVEIDAVLDARDVAKELLEAIERLRPFGEGHPQPQFALRARLERARAVGRDDATLQLHVGGIKGVAWRMGHRAAELPVGRDVDVAVSLHENEWRGTTSVEFQATEIRAPRPLAFASTGAGSPAASTALSPDLAPSAADAADGPGRSAAIRRGAPRPELQRDSRVVASPDAGALPPADAIGQAEALWLRAIPLARDEGDAVTPDATAPLRRLLAAAQAADVPLYVDLDASARALISQAVDDLPTLRLVRRGFVALRHGRPMPFGDPLAARVRAVLHDLDLIDELGRARRSVRRDPYDSPRLMAFELERYRLRGLLDAYALLDDAAFAEAVATLLVHDAPPDTSAVEGEAAATLHADDGAGASRDGRTEMRTTPDA